MAKSVEPGAAELGIEAPQTKLDRTSKESVSTAATEAPDAAKEPAELASEQSSEITAGGYAGRRKRKKKGTLAEAGSAD
jgi:hypothetical protein